MSNASVLMKSFVIGLEIDSKITIIFIYAKCK